MQQRNVMAQLRRLSVAILGAVLLLNAPFAQADTSADASTQLTMLIQTLPDSDITVDALTTHEIPVAPQLARTIDLTAPTDDLWERIRNGFAMINLNDDLVLYYQQWYQNRPDALRRMVERSRPYLHYIVEELEARGMPTELALLPMVESAFNPNAYSPARASGLWQFIPATGKRFNLEQNWWHDERRDILASTSAALDYLQVIYEMQGDWHLALASYNWGEGAVKRAVSKNEARGLPTDYPNLTMPNETRNYVPKLQALKNIFGNAALVAQLDIPRIPNQPYFATLETRRPIDVKTAARLANMSLEDFQRLNPSHNRPIIKPDTPVVVPADKLEAFRNNLANTKAPLTQWQAYTVTSPERLSQIADRFDTTTSELARVNGLSERVRLGAGSTLLVPGGGANAALTNLLSEAAPQHIIEPEPRPCIKSGKRGKKSAKACSTRDVRLASKTRDVSARNSKASAKSSQANAKPARTSAKVASKSKAPAAKPAKSSGGKVAKSAKGRRG